MKVFHEEKHVKTIPKKFKILGEGYLSKLFAESERKRLNRRERFELEVRLYKTQLEKYVKELVNDLPFERCEHVTTNRQEEYHVIVFGRYKLKCTQHIFDLAPTTCKTFRTT